MKPLKIAHTDGHTDVCYDSSGNFILTSGADGKICIWEGRDDTDTTTVNIGNSIFAIAFQGGRFFAATNENTIQIHTFPDGVGDGMVTRFTAPCRHFCICEDGSILVAGADDFKIKVISMEENECTVLYSGHQAPVLSVCLDPTREFVASSSCDGTVKIWSIVDGATEKTLNLLTKCNEVGQAKTLCRMCWSHDGEFLLVPVESEIHIYLRSSWEVVRKVSSSDIKEVINVMSMCPDGKHVAVGCSNGGIAVFDWQNNRLVDKWTQEGPENLKVNDLNEIWLGKQSYSLPPDHIVPFRAVKEPCHYVQLLLGHSHPKHLAITSVAWNPLKWSELAFCDNVGQLGFLDIAAVENKTEVTANGSRAFDDVDDDMLISASGHPSKDMDDVNKFLEDDDNSIDIGSIKRSLNLDNEDTNSMAASKDGDSKPAPPSVPMMSLPADIFKPTPPQAPFQPGSTPEHLSSRFMIWNSVGIVRQYVSDDENSIDVEFHDTTTHHALHIDNKSDYVMAALSKQAVLFASREEDDNPSKLFCMHFGSWDSHKEWSYSMPIGEDIRAITVTNGWVAVATESRMLRMFTLGGLQRQIFSLPGNVVALASHENTLLVVYHKGMGLPGDQFMGVMVLQVQGNTRRMIINDTLPLSPASKLSWIGFSEEGNVFYMDVAGVVRMLNRNFSSTWCPVANTKQHVKGKSDHYWLVSVCEKFQQLRCVPCKGSRFPATLPRPALAVLSFQLPMCDPESEKTQYEETYQRSYMFAKNLTGPDIDEEELNKPVREALIRLFAFAAKSERDFRALEVCGMMEDHNLLHLAATYATRLRRIQLAERVSEFMQERQESLEQKQDDEQESEEEDQTESASNTFSQSNVVDNDDDTEMGTENEETVDSDNKNFSSGPILKTSVEKESKFKIKSSGRPNPFKMLTVADKKPTKGTQIFDKMEKTTPKASPIFAPLPVNIKKSTKKQTVNQPKLTSFKKEDKKETKSSLNQEVSENVVVKKKVSAFSLWYEESKADLMEEHPELSEEDLGQAGAEKFRALSKEERELWVMKAKEASSEVEPSKKRKLSGDSDGKGTQEEQKRIKTESKPLSQTTNAKLAKFAKQE